MTLSSDDVPMRVEISGKSNPFEQPIARLSQKSLAPPAVFQKSWNKNTPSRLYVDECNRPRPCTAEGTVKH
jgi:hypothetical protein